MAAPAVSTPPPSQADRPSLSSIDEVREYLWKVHGTTIGREDPVLMVVTLHNLFLAEINQLLAEQSTKLAGVVEHTAGQFASRTEKTIKEFEANTLGQALTRKAEALAELLALAEQAQAAQKRMAKEASATQKRLVRTMLIVSAFNAGVIALAFAVLLFVLR